MTELFIYDVFWGKSIGTQSYTGPDDIPAYILKAAAHELAPILTHLYQSSLFKKGERN
jgi:hypothetical protein